jgi:hypothetical protein
MKRNILPQLTVFSFIVFIAFVLTTNVVDAQLVPCGNTLGNECRVCDLQVLAMNLINFFVMVSVFVAALLFVNAGFLYILSSTNPGNIAKAHKLFFNTLVGFIIILGAYLIISAIMTVLYGDATTPSELFSVAGNWNEILNCP